MDLIISRPFYMASRDIAGFYIFTKQSLNKSTQVFSTTESKLLVNNDNKTVISFSHGGNYGTYEKTINKWQGDDLVEIRRLEQTYKSKTGNELVEEFEIKNGKEIKTKTQKLNQDEAEQYFENYK